MARKQHQFSQHHGFLQKLRDRRRVRIARLRRKSLSEGLARAPFEKLEDRHLLAVTWDGGGDNQSWSDPQNWDSDTLPVATDDVIINDLSAELIIQIDTNVEVASIDSTEHLRVVESELRTNSLMASEITFEDGTLNPISGAQSVNILGQMTVSGSATQFMILGNVQVGGDLDLHPGMTLIATGGDASLSVTGNVELEGVDLRAVDGAVISFPAVTEIQHQSVDFNDDLYIEAQGAGSRIELDGVTTITGGTHRGADVFVFAHEGGVISLSNVETVMDPARGDTRSRSFQFEAIGTDSEIDLSSVVSVLDRNTDERSGLYESKRRQDSLRCTGVRDRLQSNGGLSDRQ